MAVMRRMSMDFSQKVQERSAKIGVIGLGYVGLPRLQGFHEAGIGVKCKLGLGILW
jgi:UDP-N-acetyl-D-mannosaminuronate dehydrogenase